MPNWFTSWLAQPFERKESQFGPLIARVGVGHPAWPDRNQELQARDGYQRNVVAYRCVRMVAEAAASVPLLLFNSRTKKEVQQHEFLDLLDQPNPMQDGTSLFEAWYSFMQITGNSYLERVDGLGGRPNELYTLRPDRMQVVPGAKGFPQAYKFSVSGMTRTVPVDYDNGDIPILHMRQFHPLSDWYGMSPLDPGAWSVDTHSGASQFNKAILDNSAVPSGAMKVVPDKEGKADLSEPQRERLKAELEARFQGARNAGRPMVLEGNLDWVAFGLTMKDLQFIETKRDSAREIAMGFGVPSMLLGIPGDNTYSNYQEANKALWRQTVIPLVRRGARALTNWLGPSFGPNLRLQPDLDSIDALADERQAAWDRTEKSVSLTVNEKRVAHGFDERPEGNVIVLPAHSTTLNLIGKNDKPPRDVEDPEE